ncbi:hypothetical protein [Nocardia sp. NPDC051463]|uniref:hypothetical protein n=1 Tax=Nocardia sp. NPDC051463 TaxID=3154845 RepID=UPI00344E902D
MAHRVGGSTLIRRRVLLRTRAHVVIHAERGLLAADAAPLVTEIAVELADRVLEWPTGTRRG